MYNRQNEMCRFPKRNVTLKCIFRFKCFTIINVLNLYMVINCCKGS